MRFTILQYINNYTIFLKARPHNTGSFMPYSLRIVCGFDSLTSPVIRLKIQETGPTVYRPFPRRLECLTNYKGSTFSSVIFKTLSVGPVRGSNPRPPAQQSGALPTELP